MNMPKVLFLCTGNSCRSQMAEGWARALAPNRFEAFSAGIYPCFVHPLAIKVMREAGVDITGQYSKHVEELDGIPFDYVVTLCGHADENCPASPLHGKRLHRPFDDPVFARGTESEVLDSFRAVRDKIRRFVEGMPGNLEENGG
jgi:arsenate reductase